MALKYSAAVGGVLPALETVTRARSIAPLHSISGVLNGTTNFILDQLANGSDLADAVSAAQKNGYAERDPQLDLNGTDAAQKLILLVRAAFDVDLPLNSIEKQGIQDLNANQIRDARNNGRMTRLVAECRREPHGFAATVSPVELPFDHPLARVSGVENRLIIQSQTEGHGTFAAAVQDVGPRPRRLWLICLISGANQSTNAAEKEQECVA